MDERTIQAFWNQHPCGDAQVGGLTEGHAGDYEQFFRAYDSFRYTNESHIPAVLDDLDLRGRAVLEIGLGEGAESEQLIRRGARWSGLDLTKEAVDRVAMRLSLRALPYEDLRQGSVTSIPYPDKHFDMVFSHGVLHHVPDIHTAQREIRRVLKDDGEAVVMLYARWSMNYVLAILLLRRLALILSYLAWRLGLWQPSGIVGRHVTLAQEVGLRRYLAAENFVHSNTDGPDNPFSRVYDRRLVAHHFKDFEILKVYKRFMHAPPLPVHGWPGSALAGWHLWVHLRPATRHTE